MPIAGRPMLEHQVLRLQRACTLDAIVIATTDQPEDAPIVSLAKRLDVEVFAGSVDDVLDRVYRAARAARADIVVRSTADCPLIDPVIVDQFVDHFLAHQSELDYLGVGPSYAEGLDVEVMSFSALEEAWRAADKNYEREHVTVHLWQSGRFRAKRLEHDPDLSAMRWTVDEARDFAFVTAVYDALYPVYGHAFGTSEVLRLLANDPDLRAINQGITRNEGFLKSLREDRAMGLRMLTDKLSQSEAYWARARGLIPAGTQTLSKGPTQYVDGVAPKYLLRGKGCRVWDADGNEYIDYPMGLGAVILGHDYPPVSDAIRRQLAEGFSFSLMHPLEVEVSELLREIIPTAEMVRFGKNGSDATTGAVRVARAYTGRDLIACCGYHGWQDWYIGTTTRGRGVPEAIRELTIPFEYNNIDSLRAIFTAHPGQVAGVIIEPYGATLPKEGFLSDVRDLSHEQGAVLIFDEVASGFRFHLGGIYQYFRVEPDLACFGKAMGNGMPVAALVGKAAIMQVLDDVFYSFTFGGEALSLAAVRATIEEMRTKAVIQHLWEVGERLLTGLNRLIADYGLEHYMECVGLAPRTFVVFRDIGNTPALLVKSLFQQEVIKRGVLAISAAHCVSFSHAIDDIEYTLGVYQEACEILAGAVRRGNIAGLIEGRPIQPVFRPVS